MPSVTPSPPPRILLIDAYDSFTSNLSSLLSHATGATVHTIHIDTFTLPTLLPFLSSFHALVIGPGPGHPSTPTDTGIIPHLFHLPQTHTLPIFGVCLGLQSLCLSFGARIERLTTVKHGLVSPITHTGSGLFDSVGTVNAVRYHSLHAVLPPPSHGDTGIEPLAWTTDENGTVLMAARHKHRPFYGVQYHPESVCTVGGGESVVRNFWRLAGEWNRVQGREVVGLPESWTVRPRGMGLLGRQVEYECRRGVYRERRRREVRTEVLDVRVGVESVCEMFGVEDAEEFVVLDSAAAPGRWSVLGVLTQGVTETVGYRVGDSYVTVSRVGRKGSAEKVGLGEYEGSVWRFLARYMDGRKATGGCEESPFWGGLMGYFNYEVGVAALDVPIRPRKGTSGRIPDVNLVFVERSIVIDGHTGRIYIQTLLPSDSSWLASTKQRLQLLSDFSNTPAGTPPPSSPRAKLAPEIYPPNKQTYLSAIHTAQSHLATGNSYELCLTAQTTILQPRFTAPHPWHIFTSLRLRNPAPYAAYLRLQGATLVSSSPERFLSWTRNGTCQLRPIKGTVRKSPSTTLAAATRTLNTPKERAENLMIVDLIRHDLHNLADTVDVKKLMVVEEYAHVYQLVSVIEGILPRSEGAPTGFDVLAGSLPPGSMTGAPKKRSVELLQGIEDCERGVYSGVAGYWSVCGAGDWSVVIRSAVRVDKEVEEGAGGEECDVWRIGAGGAITALSVAEEEWEEMETKLNSTLKAFLG